MCFDSGHVVRACVHLRRKESDAFRYFFFFIAFQFHRVSRLNWLAIISHVASRGAAAFETAGTNKFAPRNTCGGGRADDIIPRVCAPRPDP